MPGWSGAMDSWFEGQPMCCHVAGVKGPSSLGMLRSVSWERGPVLKGFKCLLILAGPEEVKSESPWSWAWSSCPPKQEWPAVGVTESSIVGASFVGMGMEASQGLVPIIKWGLERLLRVKSRLQFGCIWGSVGGPWSSGTWPGCFWHVAEPRAPLALAPDPGHLCPFWNLMIHCLQSQTRLQSRPCNVIDLVLPWSVGEQ